MLFYVTLCCNGPLLKNVTISNYSSFEDFFSLWNLKVEHQHKKKGLHESVHQWLKKRKEKLRLITIQHKSTAGDKHVG
jgi:hypothetical protein